MGLMKLSGNMPQHVRLKVSVLFCAPELHYENGFSGARVQRQTEHHSPVRSGALPTSLENWKDKIRARSYS